MSMGRPGGGPGGGGPGGGGPGLRGHIKPKNTGKTLKRILSYLQGSRALLLVAVICLIPPAVSGAIIAGITGNIIDLFASLVSTRLLSSVVLEQAIWPQIFAEFGKMLGLVAVSICASFVQAKVMLTASMRGTNLLRKEMFAKMQQLPLSYFDRHTHGELMSRFTNDADNVQTAMSQSLMSFISSILTFVGVVVALLRLSWKLSAIPAVGLVITLFVFRFMGSRSRKYYRNQQAAIGNLNGNVQETIEGLRVVKAFTHETQAKADFAALNENLQSVSQNAAFFSVALMPILGNVTNLSYAAAALFCGIGLATGTMTLGNLQTFLLLCRQMGQPVNQISMQSSAVLAALAGAERIFDMMDALPEQDKGKVRLVPVHKNEDGSLVEYEAGRRGRNFAWKLPDGELHLVRGDVRLENVDFSYIEGKPVLKNVSVFAKPGQKIAFVGSTGAGKTTITNLINRFYEIQSGVITYDGIDVRDIEKDSLRRSLGAVLQDVHLFTGTILENIRYGRLEASDEACIAAAKTAGAHSFISKLPEGYNTHVTGDGGNLSQGQRQLLAIARAAVADPPVMILDEATSSIDTRTETLIERGMDALMVGRTVFVIAHRLSTVRNSNAIMVIEQGEIIERGDHRELLELGGRYHQLCTGSAMLE